MKQAVATCAGSITVWFLVGLSPLISAAALDPAAVAAENCPLNSPVGRQCVDVRDVAAPWGASRQPEPPHVLYTPQNPAPAIAPHEESWHFRMIFPQTTCAHCGRPSESRKASYLFLLLGFLGQGLFALRFFVQWLASERAQTVVVPESFWWISIAAVIVTFFYAASILAWPILLGQALALFIYGRNLYFFRR